MENNNRPTVANGKICYIEIPAMDIYTSANFYQKVFGWRLRKDNEGNISFDDTIGEVSGMWVTGRKPSAEPGLLISIMVFDMGITINAIIAEGGKIVQQPDMAASERIALFSDPAGNIFCLYQASSG